MSALGDVAAPGTGSVWGLPGQVQITDRVTMYTDLFVEAQVVHSLVGGRHQTHFCIGENSFVDVLAVDQHDRVYLGAQRRTNDAGVLRAQGFAGSLEEGESLREAAARELGEEFRRAYGQEVEIVETIFLGEWTQNDAKLYDKDPEHNRPDGHPSCKYCFGMLIRVNLLGEVETNAPVLEDEIIDRLPPIPIEELVRYAVAGFIPGEATHGLYPEGLRCDNGDTTDLIFRTFLYLRHPEIFGSESAVLTSLPFPVAL